MKKKKLKCDHMEKDADEEVELIIEGKHSNIGICKECLKAMGLEDDKNK